MIQMAQDSVEMDELCVSRKRNVWLWTAVSRQMSQILAFVLGDRSGPNVDALRALLPEAWKAWKRRLTYTDFYAAYSERLPASRHRPCEKGDGGTSVVEGVSNSLRHRCSFLARRNSGPRHHLEGITLRLDRAVRAHNHACQKRRQRYQQTRVKQATTSGT